jgi:carbon storage regulator CsrA
MLVLARKKAETILIGEEIVIKVLQMRNGVVRIGIDAPSSVRVMRGEVRGRQVSGGDATGALPTSTTDPEQDSLSSSFAMEVTLIEEHCRPAVPSNPNLELNQNPRVNSPPPAAPPLAAVLRALRVVPPGTEGSALQVRSPHRN